VQHEDRRSLATDPDVDRRAVGLDLLRADARRKWLDLGYGRQRQEQGAEDRSLCHLPALYGIDRI
jgi:hypothetical protein